MADNHFTKRDLSRAREEFVATHLGSSLNQLIHTFQKNSQALESNEFFYNNQLFSLLQQKSRPTEKESHPMETRDAHEHWVVSE